MNIDSFEKPENIAIIGAGVIGLSIAVLLRQQGYMVTLVDQAGVAEGASKGNAGHFATEQVFPLADPTILPQLPKMMMDPLGPLRIAPQYFLKAMPWFVKFMGQMTQHNRAHNTEALKALNRHSLPALQNMLDITNSRELYRQDGALLVFEQAEQDLAKAMLLRFNQHDVSANLLHGGAVRELEPHLSPDIQHGLFFDAVAHTISPHQLCLKYWQYLQRNDVSLEKMKVDFISPNGVKVVIGNSEKSIYADKVVIAAGAYSKNLVQQLGYDVPLDTERGYHLMMPIQDALTRPVSSAERKFIMTSMTDGLCLAGSVEFAGLEAKANYQRAQMLRHHGAALLPSIRDIEPQSQWMGRRPSLPDSLPVIDMSSQYTNVLFAFGHQHLGLTQSAITAELILSLLQNKKATIDMSPYSISRFG